MKKIVMTIGAVLAAAGLIVGAGALATAAESKVTVAVSADTPKDEPTPEVVKPGEIVITPPSTMSGDVAAGLFAIRDFGPAQHPDTYAGVDTSDPSGPNVLVVYLTTDADEVRDEFIAAANLPADAVTFRQVSFPEEELLALEAQIISDIPSLQAEGFDIRGWGIAPDYRGFNVDLFGSTETQRDALTTKYGAALILTLDPEVERPIDF